MFDVSELQETVLLHKRSYELLRWVGLNLRKNTLSFNVVHESMTKVEAAKEWVQRNLHSIPQSARPEAAQVDKFAYLFSSYLATSFELKASGGKRLYSDCGCYCEYCTYLAAADQLQVKNPSKGAREDATELKRIYLQGLLTSLKLRTDWDAVDAVYKKCDEQVIESLSMTTYAQELIRRTRFASQGDGVLVLWREFAWSKGDNPAPRKNFEFSAEAVCKAEKLLAATLGRLAVAK